MAWGVTESSHARRRDRPHFSRLGAFGRGLGARDPHVYPFSTYKRSIKLTFQRVLIDGREPFQSCFLTTVAANVLSVVNLTYGTTGVQVFRASFLKPGMVPTRSRRPY